MAVSDWRSVRVFEGCVAAGEASRRLNTQQEVVTSIGLRDRAHIGRSSPPLALRFTMTQNHWLN
jgi:hypothetical protein